MPLEQIAEEVKERYHFYFVIPGGASHGSDQKVLGFWARLAGPDRVLQLEDAADTSECIALAIGVNEGVITAGDGIEHLRKRGVVARTLDGVAKALASLIPGSKADPARPRHL